MRHHLCLVRQRHRGLLRRRVDEGFIQNAWSNSSEGNAVDVANMKQLWTEGNDRTHNDLDKSASFLGLQVGIRRLKRANSF